MKLRENPNPDQADAAPAREGDAAPAWVDHILAQLNAEQRLAKELQRRNYARQSGKKSWSNADLTQFRDLFALSYRAFPLGYRKIAGSFLNRWKKSDWMRQQRGYREKIALVLAAEPWSAPRWIAYCRPWRLCRDPACPRCNYFLRVAAAQYEFGGMFQKARENGLHVVGLVPSFTFDASAGGLHFVLRKLPNGKPKDFRNERPFHGRYDTILLRGDEDPELIQTLRDLLKVLPRLLREVGLVEGAFWQPEFKMSFHPVVRG